MTVSRLELPQPDTRESGARRRLSPNGLEDSPFVAPDRPSLALALHDLLSLMSSSFNYGMATMRPQVKPQSSRAIAVTATCDFLPRLTRRVYRRCSRVWAFRTYSTV